MPFQQKAYLAARAAGEPVLKNKMKTHLYPCIFWHNSAILPHSI